MILVKIMQEIRIDKLYINDYHHIIAINFIGKKLINNKLYLAIKNNLFNINSLKILSQELDKNYF
jgi:hypothetical protein